MDADLPTKLFLVRVFRGKIELMGYRVLVLFHFK